MEPLTQTISLARPRGLVWKQLEAVGDWAIRFPANDGVVFTYVLGGRCQCTVDGEVHDLHEGDFVMLVRPPVWELGNGKSRQPIDYVAGHPTVARLGDGDGPVTATAGGRFVFDETNASLLKELLPPFTLLRSGVANQGRVGSLLALLGDEATASRPGQSFVLERLMELLLAEVIRDPLATTAASRPGLLRGLADSRIAKALAAMHADVCHRWTVGELASLAGASRSSFAAHFTSIVGLPPIDYLLRWRMALAKDALKNGNLKLAAIAEKVGYMSVSAFSTAFTRTVGCPPSSFG
jgi:AraC-like DNA-binding protein